MGMTTTTLTPANPTLTLGEPSQVVTYPISVDYVKKWTLVRALSEAVANAIDADPFGFSVSYDEVTQEMIIEDHAEGGLGAESMIFGWSDKSSRTDVIGQFGEGLKIATIRAVSDKSVRHMLIETVGMLIVPQVVDYSTVSGLNIPTRTNKAPRVLAWSLYPSDREAGTRLRLGVDKSVYSEVIARFRHIVVPNYSAPAQGANILVDEPGNIYIGGVYVNNIHGLLFGYDFSFETAKFFQNRDRNIIDEARLRHAVRSTVSNVDDIDILVKVIKAAMDGTLSDTEKGFLAVLPYERTARITKAWHDAAEIALGDTTDNFFYREDIYDTETSLVLRDVNMKELVPNGLSQYDFVSMMTLIGVKAAKKVKPKDIKQEITWCKGRLTADEKKRLDTAVAALRKFFTDDAIDKVRVYEDITMNAKVSECTTLGFYNPNNGLIAIRRSQLAYDKTTWDTLFHEVAHRIGHKGMFGMESWGEYQDRTRGFEAVLTMMGSMIARAQVFGQDATVVAESQIPEPSFMKDNYRGVRHDTAAAMVNSFGRNQKKGNRYPTVMQESIYANRIRAIVSTAVEDWAKENGVPMKDALAMIEKKHYVSASKIRTLMTGSLSLYVSFEQVKEIGEVLSVNPGVIWWATNGVSSLFRGRSKTVKHRAHGGKNKEAAQQANAYLAECYNYADNVPTLINISEGKAGVQWDSVSWLSTIESMVEAEEQRLDSDALARNAERYSRPAHADIREAWKAALALNA